MAEVAVKVLHLSAADAAHREMRIADELADKSLQNVVPVYDSGLDPNSDRYFIIMAKATESLLDYISRLGQTEEAEAINIMLEIAYGLREVDWIVHRDLKPGNVLLHKDKWKIADFGIARFVEESTSLNTLRDCLTPPYGAPEQWLAESASALTDIYALGCIAYFLVTGDGPFPGPTNADYRYQHLNETPSPLPNVSPRLRSLVAIMLRKVKETRPSINRVIEILEHLAASKKGDEGKNGYDALAYAGAEAAEKELADEAKRLEEASRYETRMNLANAANAILQDILNTLFARIIEHAPTAKVSTARDDRRRIMLGQASLETHLISQRGPIPQEAFKESGWDVISGATIKVGQSIPKDYEWGANLWFSNLGKAEEYRWYEVPYYASGLVRTTNYAYQPFAVREFREADLAAAKVMSAINMARRPLPIDDEHLEDFCNRWADLLALAFKGQLCHPSHLPMD